MEKQKVFAITGGASGIGYALSKAMAKDGHQVVMIDINEEALKEKAAELGADYVQADLTKREDCKAAIDAINEKYEGVDVLINVAGIQHVEPIKNFPEDKWDFIISLMLTAPFLLTKYVWSHMEEKGWGRIINLNSIHGLIASEFKSAYISAKHGLAGLTKTAALEGGKYGITCNSINPAYVGTPLVLGQIANQAKEHGISEDEVVSTIMLKNSVVKEMVAPEAIADVVRLLVSDSGKYITGACLPIDGGWTAN